MVFPAAAWTPSRPFDSARRAELNLMHARANTLPKLAGIAAALLASCGAIAPLGAQQRVIPIWPGPPPGSESWSYDEGEYTRQNDGVKRITNVTRPALMAYLPEPARATGTAMVICPGGAFRWLAIEKEGTELARWLNEAGVAAFVLKYRLARMGDERENDPAVMKERIAAVRPLAAADGLQAIRAVREHAAEWGIKPDRVGIIGFSAGGYVAASAALTHDSQSRPDFAALVYALAPEFWSAPADAPPALLVAADDDKSVPSQDNTVRLYLAWQKAGIPAEMHIYPRGGHGFGMKKNGAPSDTWTERLRDWLTERGLLTKPQG